MTTGEIIASIVGVFGVIGTLLGAATLHGRGMQRLAVVERETAEVKALIAAERLAVGSKLDGMEQSLVELKVSLARQETMLGVISRQLRCPPDDAAGG